MTKRTFYKTIVLLGAIVSSQSFLASTTPQSPFEPYNPNIAKPTATTQGGMPNNGVLSPESEMQVMELISRELMMREGRLQRDKEAGLAPLDNNEILYLGPNEALSGTMGSNYIIINKTTNMFRNEDMTKYKKVVTSDEAQNIIEKENLKEQTQGKITQ